MNPQAWQSYIVVLKQLHLQGNVPQHMCCFCCCTIGVQLPQTLRTHHQIIQVPQWYWRQAPRSTAAANSIFPEQGLTAVKG